MFDIEEIKRKYPLEKYTVGEALKLYFLDTVSISGIETADDIVVLMAALVAIKPKMDNAKRIKCIRDIIIAEATESRNPWEVLEEELIDEEETEEEKIEGTLGL